MINEKKLIKDLIPLLNEHGDMYIAGRIIGRIVLCIILYTETERHVRR